MNRRLIHLIGLGLLTALVLTPNGRGQQKPEALAQQAAQSWLALVDAGQYGVSWDTASSFFKAAVTRQKWEAQVRGARGPLGKVQSRKLKSAQYMKDPPSAPAGEYVGIQYDTSFAKVKSAIETVVPTLDKDGKWRVSGYYIKQGQ